MNAATFSLGARLRNLRKERDLTQRNLATFAGISVNAVSLIERNEISPSVTTLQSLAGALRVKMSYFFDDTVDSNVIYQKAKDRPSIDGQGMLIESVGSKMQGQQMEPFFLTLEPHSNSGKQAVVHSGHEFVYCLGGKVEYEVDAITYSLETGDIVLFKATLPHSWKNITDQTASILILIQTPEETTESMRRHFPNHPSIPHIG